ncbi:disulfide bond formation protein [Saccharopolyspora karakumensis]|uniref:Disulfide bond formation protein n=1 Tax=Saccharopolyspora karakumensis TaxID=2530386 RepID=A0A4R5BQA6_9PSEU|nr:thioredoxin domain-containing protein [Saccharopolyspora karakumensis]TDD86144.1 disulfide bond formation protein [Saccharopolyspora karakumensis]
MSGAGKKKWLNVTAVVLAVVAAFLLGSMLTSQGGSDQAAPQQAEKQQESPLARLARRAPDDPLALGRHDAPVVMLNYSDFRCPFCAKFTRDIEPELIKRYVDAGVLRIEWRDFPIFGEESLGASRAGRAAAAQGKFWEYVGTIHQDAPEKGHPSLPRDKLVDYAKQVGITDIAKFEADMNAPATLEAIRADAMEGSQIGVSSTPTFLVNGEPILGAQPLDQFVQTIERAEAAAR